MATSVRSDRPLTLIRGRPFRKPIRWQNPDGSPVDLTGMTFRAGVRWRGGNAVANLVLPADLTQGQWLAVVPDTLFVPAACGAALRMTATDTAGETHDITYPLAVIDP